MNSYKFLASCPSGWRGWFAKPFYHRFESDRRLQSRTSLTGAFFFSTNYTKRSTSEKAQYDLSSSYCVWDFSSMRLINSQKYRILFKYSNQDYMLNDGFGVHKNPYKFSSQQIFTFLQEKLMVFTTCPSTLLLFTHIGCVTNGKRPCFTYLSILKVILSC